MTDHDETRVWDQEVDLTQNSAPSSEERRYYVPLGAYTYNDCYIPSHHRRPRIILKGPLHHFKRLCHQVYRATDEYHDGEGTTPWIDNEHMYEVQAYFGYPEARLMFKNGRPRKAKDTDALFKLTIDSLFEYAGVGDQHVNTVAGVRVITSRVGAEPSRHMLDKPLHFTSSQRKMGREFMEKHHDHHDDTFFMFHVRRSPIQFCMEDMVPGLTEAKEIMDEILPTVRERYTVSWKETP